jgi:hypothetical protein
MNPVPYRLGLHYKHLVVEVAGDELWGLDKVNLLVKPPQIRFLRVKPDMKAKVFGETSWDPIPPTLGIVRHKAVLARIIDSMTPEETVRLINHYASQQEAGPIVNGILSDDHGRAFLTQKDLDWGWRLERQENTWTVQRYHSKRVSPVTESILRFSRYGSLCIPVHELVTSIAKDFGTFVDPYSLKDLYLRDKKGRKYMHGKCVTIPWVKEEPVRA